MGSRPCQGALAVLAMIFVMAPFGSLSALAATGESARPFSFDGLRAQAQERARRAYQPRALAQDNPLRDLSYDDYRRIVFDPEAAIWRDQDTPFQLQLFHPGFLHTKPVGLHLVRAGQVRSLAFDTGVFNYHDSPVETDRVDADGYAGFRVHHPINTGARFEEFLVFLGASYFRAVAQHQFYGLSARGLAVNTVGEGDEEFPRFTDFWIEQPGHDARELVVYALLDSPSVTGAYRFSVRPGETTVMDVDVHLYSRRDLPRVGIAPLTSMFMFDTSNRAGFDDFRGAVHDSDGLQILQADGEQIWRPLRNPTEVGVSSFGATDTAPAGFGLLQRRQRFEQFGDTEARYHKRPSLWIEPVSDWGEGRVELLEIPTDVEYHDNIVAYWQPAGGLQAGKEHHFAYRMHWAGESPQAPAQGRVVSTAAGRSVNGDERVFVIDYSGGEALKALNPEELRLNATTSAGEITHVRGHYVADTGHYRVYLQLDPGSAELAELAELRLTLALKGKPWGETWLYRWTP